MTRPNIIFYFSDQQRADTCGCYGQTLPLTPVADALAAEGALFEHAFSPQPVCGPARACFQTGRFPTATGCFRNNVALPLDADTIGRRFEAAGYETAYVGKWHLASDGALESSPAIDYHHSAVPPERRGGYTGFWRASDVLEFTSDSRGGYVFDEDMRKREFSGYRTDCITDFALEFLEGRTGERPFFLTVSHIEPHHQNDAGHYQGPAGSKEKYRHAVLPHDLEVLGGDAEEEYPDYLGACGSVDRNLGRIVETLKRKGLYEDTVIVFTSDHGSHFRTRNRDGRLNGYDDYKRTGHDAALRVPLVIRGGRFRGGRTVRELVSTASLARTLLAAAGIPAGERMDGEDLARLLDGPVPGRPNEVFAQISESRVGRVLRTERFKYGVYAPHKHGGRFMDSGEYADDYLYDLDRDPWELEDRADDPAYREEKLRLRERLLAWIRSIEGKEAVILDL